MFSDSDSHVPRAANDSCTAAELETRIRLTLSSKEQTTSLAMAVSVKVTKVWPVEKYARFISDPALPAALLEGKRSGAWQVN